MSLELDRALVERWISIANEELPMQSHVFDRDENSLKVLNQLLLPEASEYVEIRSVGDGYAAIKEMIVRGAPLIATVGMLSLVVDLYHPCTEEDQCTSTKEFGRLVCGKCDHLVSARPTAVNLSNIAEELKAFVRGMADSSTTTAYEMRDKVREFLLKWQDAEREENDLLIRNSVAAVAARNKSKLAGGGKLTVMTICNTGSLATSSFGTALGAIFHLNRLGLLEKAVALETRPYLQGARLTAYELTQSGVPFVLVADSAAAYAMNTRQVDAVLVGADQVARNGDTANKIGTYALAVLAQFHHVPFYVVTPSSSINPYMDAGDGIRIEERAASELTLFNGKPTAPTGCKVWNPAFDVTPAALITGILTERGAFRPGELSDAIDAWKLVAPTIPEE